MLNQNGHLAIEEKIRELLVSELKVSRTVVDSCSSGTPLLGNGVGLDSVETMALIVAIEGKCDISVPDTDLNAALFESLESLSKYVLGKVEARKRVLGTAPERSH